MSQDKQDQYDVVVMEDTREVVEAHRADASPSTGLTPEALTAGAR